MLIAYIPLLVWAVDEWRNGNGRREYEELHRQPKK